MASVSDVIFYVLAFMAAYAQLFLLITFFENRKTLSAKEDAVELSRYPSVTVIVPCWNEERTVSRTVHSLFNLNYPKNKVKIILVDDGSTDNTWRIISSYAKFPNVKVFRKGNGGKHTALNLGLEHTDTEFIGCLDADSEADPESLVRLMSFFEKKPELMAVTPSIVVRRAGNAVERAQKAEYYMSNVFVKKMQAFLGAIHVTPGPLTIFRKKVFEDLGPYRYAHNTEDMEIAYRMQQNHYPIEQCHNAFVFTGTPPSIKKLYKQRLRWIYGFINNTIDYRKTLFRRKYGNFALFTVPSGILALVASSYIFGRMIWAMAEMVSSKLMEYQTVGLKLAPQPIDLFFFNTQSTLFIGVFITVLVFVTVFLGYKMAEGKGVVFSMDVVYFFLIFSFIAPFWLLQALLNTAMARKPSWR